MPQLPDINLSGLGVILQLIVAFLGAYLIAVWISLVVWTFRDVRARTRDLIAQLLAVLLVLVFNLPGLLLYFLLRPRETLAEQTERELAEEALLQDIQDRQECPVCHAKNIQPDFVICPNCQTKLRKKCEHCGRILNLKWNVCPYCGENQTVPNTRDRTPAPPRVKPQPLRPSPEPPAAMTPPQTETGH